MSASAAQPLTLYVLVHFKISFSGSDAPSCCSRAFEDQADRPLTCGIDVTLQWIVAARPLTGAIDQAARPLTCGIAVIWLQWVAAARPLTCAIYQSSSSHLQGQRLRRSLAQCSNSSATRVLMPQPFFSARSVQGWRLISTACALGSA